MTHLRILAALIALAVTPAFAQVTPGSGPLTGPKGGTNNSFMQFTGPASSLKTYTLPNASGTVDLLNAVQTFTAAKTFSDLTLLLAGSTSGTTTLKASAAASGVLTLPAATDTLVGKATTDTLTNKTFDTAATGNSLSVNGLAATANSGTGAIARAVGPVFTNPSLGEATATTINGNTISTGTGTLTLGAGKTATVSNTLTFVGTDGSTVTLGSGGTVAYLANTLNAFASTTSAQLASVISDETGSGALVFGTSPTLVAPTIGAATATSINKVAVTAPATGATLTIPDGVTLTGPAASGTAMTLGNAETVSGAKSFNDTTVILKGATSGTTTLKAAAAAGTTTVTLPAATDTLVGKSTTDTLTNKTYDTAGIGNSFSINGLAATANTGTGAVVRSASPTLTTPSISSILNTGTLTLPSSTDTLVGRATTDTLTNKTFDTAGTGNSFSVNGVAVTANTGTGAIARATSPSFTNPVVGTQAANDNSTKAASTAYADAGDALKANANNAALTGVVNFQGARKDSTQTAPAQITADQNDYNPSSSVCATTSTLLINSDAARNITGISGGVAGCDLFLFNNGAFPITLKDGSSSSSAGNRLDFGADFVLASKAAAHLKYDGASSRWRNATGSGSGGGGGSGTVTQVNTAGLASGGPITSSGTVTVSVASQSDQEAASSSAAAVTPSVQQYHPSAAKAWGYITNNGTTVAVAAGYNVSSVSRIGAGQVQVNFTASFSSTNYAVVTTVFRNSGDGPITQDIAAMAAGNFSMVTLTAGNANADRNFFFVCYGDQ